MSLSVISSPHFSPEICHYKETPGTGFRSVTKCKLHDTIYYPPTPHLIPSSPIFQPRRVRKQKVLLDKLNNFSAKPRSYTETMPSTEKLLHFLSSSFLCAAGVILLGYGMSADWATANMACAPSDSEEFNGSSSLKIGLFNGTETKISCPRISKIGEKVPVFDRLLKVAGAPIILHALVVILLAMALFGSAGSILVTLYNSFSNPYQTYMGPIGLYTCSGLSVCVASLALILYVSNAFLGEMFEALVRADEAKVALKDVKINLQVGFFLLIPYICFNVAAILVVYMYVHAAYTRRKEQEKPTEDAPKEIMMY